MSGLTIQPAPSRFGKGDERGALNLLNAQSILSAAPLIRSGKTYSLAVVTDADTPAYGNRNFAIQVMEPALYGGATWGDTKANAIDEFMMVWPGTGTHIDGLGHVGIDRVFYDQTPGSDFYDFSGLKKFGTHSLPPIVGRGIMIDVAASKGVAMLDGGQAILPSDLREALDRQGLAIESGDIVMIRTGWMALMRENPERYLASAPGIGIEAAQYLADCGVVMIGSDQASTEVYPAERPGEFAPVHQLNLAVNGVYHLQNAYLDDLAADAVNEFFFVLGVPRFFGASQMTVNPVAIV